MANGFEDLAASMGIDLSAPSTVFETPTEDATETPTTEETTEQADEAVEESNVLENDETITDSTDVEETVEQPVAEEQTDVTNETPTEPTDDSLIEVEEAIEEEDNISDSEYEQMLFSTVGEMLGMEDMSKESLLERLNTEQTAAPVELDPSVQAIADFVSETGRSVEEWFAYQNLNPSEMDDVSVMKNNLLSQYPDLSDSDAELLLENKYKTDSDMHTEQDARLGALQLKMDASTARKELETTRSKYLAPVKEEVAAPVDPIQEELESPITAEWVSQMSKVADDMEALEFNVGKDQTFAFGVSDNYKSELKQSNAKMDDYFDQYVSEQGDWNFEKLNVHRTILDNIENIVDAAFKQGLSQGTSNVVKQAVNPSNVNPNTSSTPTASSSQDMVTKQILNALQGGDDTLRMKF
tara:strand:+ start:4829 stop:6064 length:1236 start_codon:yes stop_codon:yes gene_type:complete